MEVSNSASYIAVEGEKVAILSLSTHTRSGSATLSTAARTVRDRGCSLGNHVFLTGFRFVNANKVEKV